MFPRLRRLKKVYSIHSACTATAYLSGVKNNYRGLGVNANIGSSQCEYSEDDFVYSIGQWAQKANKATGLVTTARITHATPAGLYANIPHRDWEHNNALPQNCRDIEGLDIPDIARQLVYNDVSKNLKVVLGGGRSYFINNTSVDDEGQRGLRTDGKNLINEWVTERTKQGAAKFVSHGQELREVDIEKTDYLLGLFEGNHCLYNLDIFNNKLEYQEPSLTEMTVKALKMLQKEENKDGYFLFVEAARIDTAHHDNWIQKSLEETKEFARTIDMVRQMTNEEDTLIVVSSDHSHSFTYSGYADRGNDILGSAGDSDIDDLPYETLSYANGPGYHAGTTRNDLSKVDLKNPERSAAATVPLSSETHAGDDVGVYASGPFSHLFTGNYEQNNLPLLMAYAAKIGAFSPLPEDTTPPTAAPTSTEATTTDSSNVKQVSMLLVIIALSCQFLFEVMSF